MAKQFQNKAKGKAWKVFAKWVRTRDCLATTNFPHAGVCITCGKKFHISFLQAGHCFPGRRNAGLFREELVNAQCTFCNETFHGKPKKYRKIMEAKYGKEQVDEWEIEGKRVIPDRDMKFEDIEKKYKQKLKELTDGKKENKI